MIDIDKETQAFEQWFSAGDHNGCGIEIWLAAKRHAAQVADSDPIGELQREAREAKLADFIGSMKGAQVAEPTDRQRSDANVEALLAPSGASVDSVARDALIIAKNHMQAMDAQTCRDDHAEAIAAIDAAMSPTKAGEGKG